MFIIKAKLKTLIMKKLITLISAVLFSGILFSQTPVLYEVGPGKAYESFLSSKSSTAPTDYPEYIPLDNLQAGDTVKVYYRETPYNEKFLLHGIGTADNPVQLIGIADANGNKPIIDGQNAVSGTVNHTNQDRQMVLIGDASASDYIIVDGFVFRNGTDKYTYTSTAGKVESYGKNAAGIRAGNGINVTIRNCEMYGNANGITASGMNNLIVENCSIHDNGNVASGTSSSQQHNCYFYGNPNSKLTVQFCRFGALLCDGQQCKFRAEQLIFRYNWVEGGNNSQLDIVDDSSNAENINAYVYGNIIVKPEFTNNGRMIHFGDDGGANRARTLYFFNNTCVINSNKTVTLFKISAAAANVIADNNIFFRSLDNYDTNLWGTNGNISGDNNWFSSGVSDMQKLQHNNLGTISFGDVENQDYHLKSGSSCIDIVSNYNFPEGHTLSYQYVRDLQKEERPVDDKLDLGAYEYVNTTSAVKLEKEPENKQIKIFGDSSILNVTVSSGSFKHGNVNIYNLKGEKVYQGSLHNGHNEIAINAAPGIFLVKAIVNNETETRKIYLSNL